MKKKRVISFVLAASMVLGTNTISAGAAEIKNDLSGHWAKAAIQKWKDYNIINGYSDGSVRPDQPITRAELVSMLNRIMQYQKSAQNVYTDCADNAWYTESILRATAAGVIQGDGTQANPLMETSRQQAAVILARVLELDTSISGSTSFADDSSIAGYARASIKAMQAAGLMNGNEHNNFNPEKPITRGEIAQVLSNSFDVIVRAGENYTKTEAGTIVLQGHNANLNGQHIKGDVIIAEGVADGEVALTNTTIDGRILVRGGGINSVYLNGTTAKKVVMNKNGSDVRLHISKDSSITHVVVADGTAGVVVDGNADKITVNGPEASVNITGKVETVELADQAKGAKLSSASTSEINNIIISAPQAKLNVSGMVSTVETSSRAEGTVIKTTSTSKITNVIAKAANTTISGEGKVTAVDAKANYIKIDTAGTKITAAEKTTGITAGGKNISPGSSGTAANSGSSSSSGGSGGSKGSGGSGSSGGSSNSGGSGNTDGSENSNQQPSAVTLVNAVQTGLKDLGWCQFVAISFAEGYNKDNCTVVIDGADVTSAITNITDNGSVAKWEITSLNPAKLTIASKENPANSQTIVLSGNTSPSMPKVVKRTAPAYILTHGPIPVWDYHLSNYDDNGKIRVSPTKTTFSTDAVTSATAKSYSADAELKKDQSYPYGVSGNVEILFNYTTQEQKEWFDSIADHGALALVSYDENKTTLNNSLEYQKSTSAHHGGTVGVLTIPIGQNNFYSNGRFNVRVMSQGHKTSMVPIHIVNEVVPTMKVSESSDIISGQNVHFQVSDMVYGITVPIETVTLTDPAGNTTVLEKIRDWYLFGGLFVLYNDENATDGRNNIPYKGVYTLTVYSNGFKTMSKKFEVAEGAEVSVIKGKTGMALTKFASVDAVASATSSGGGSSSGGSGSINTSANLIFNADLLINALLLDKMGIKNANAEAIVERWKFDVAGYDAVYHEDGINFYTWTGYNDAVRDAKLKGKYLSFADYTASDSAEITLNRPYAVKEVLEDNLLGETQSDGNYKGKIPPDIKLSNDSVQVFEGQNAVFISEDAQYLNSITAIYINGNWQALSPDKYSIDTELRSLKIDHSVLTLGNNTVEVKSAGYKSNTLQFQYEKTLEDIMLSLGAEKYKAKQDIVINVEHSTGDFLKNLQRVTLNNRQVLTEMAGGSSGNDWYETGNSQITLKAGLFPKAGEYTVVLKAAYYGEKTLTFTVDASDENGNIPPAEVLDAPDIAEFVKKETSFFTDPYYRASFDFTKDALKNYLKAITSVTVGNTEYQKSLLSFSSGDTAKFRLSDNEIFGGLSYLDLTLDGFSTSEQTIVTVKATGYKDAAFTVNSDGTLNSGAETHPPEIKKEVPSFVDLDKSSITEDEKVRIILGTNEDKAYYNVFTGIKMNSGNMQNAAELNINDSSYSFELQNLTAGEHKIILIADGYQDKTLTVHVTGSSTGNKLDVPDYVKLYKESIEYGSSASVTIASLLNSTYLKALTSVTIDSIEKQKAELGVSEYSTSFYINNLSIGEHQIVLHADGYKDKTLTVTVTPQSVPSMVKLYVNAKMVTETSIMQEIATDVKIVIGDYFTPKYKERLTTVSVNGENLSEPLLISNERISYSDYDILTVAASSLKKGANTIILNAETYLDKTFIVTVE